MVALTVTASDGKRDRSPEGDPRDSVILRKGYTAPIITQSGPIALFIVTNTNDAGLGSLRQAILDANGHAGLDAIYFSIGSGVKTINVGGTTGLPLPSITSPVIIDGTTQPGYSGSPLIELNGTSAGPSSSGLSITTKAPLSTVTGLVINRFNGTGILLEAAENVIAGNYIGTDVSGTVDLGNTQHGILVSVGGQANTIGGPTSAAGNTIAFNGGDGVFVASGVNNAILLNSIHSNTGLGIDLGSDGVGGNDACDPDTGANNLQNFPVLTSASTTTIQGTLNSRANTTFTIQFFSNSSCDAAGDGEGQTFIGSMSVTTDANCNASFFVPASLSLGQFVTATATDPNNNTSEFSSCRIVTTTLQFSSGTVSAAEAAGSTQISVTRSGGNAGAASVEFSTVVGGTAIGGASCTAGVDYVSTSGTLNWPSGHTANNMFPVTICNDTAFEGNESVNLALSNANGATLGIPNTTTLTITDNDSQPTISITDVTQAEGHSGITAFGFTVSLSNPTTQTVTVNYRTANGTAIAGADYQANATALTFNPGEISKPVTVLVIGDTLNESGETFFLNLTNAANATIADSQGMGTIANDDPVPTGNVSISGRIVDDSAHAISGLLVILGGAETGSTLTDSNGNYSFANLSSGHYTVTPSSINHSFSPTNYAFNNLTVDRIGNFVGTQTVVGITGRVTDTNDTGLGGVTLGLSMNGTTMGTMSTDFLGNYGFGNLPAGAAYVVTPVGSFSPSLLFFNSLSTNATANFKAVPSIPPASAAISGKATDANNNPLANITVTLSGPITRVTATDRAGNYSFASLAPGGNYAVTIQNNYFVFFASRADFLNLSGTQTFNFMAAPVLVPPPSPPPSDDFNGPTRDPNKWNLGIQTQPATAFDPLVNVAQINGELVITPLSQVGGSHFNGYVSANSFDLRGGSVSIELVQAATGGADTIFAVGSDLDNFYRFMVQTAGPATTQTRIAKGSDGIERPLDTTVAQLLFQVNVGGQLTALSIPYDPMQHRFMRFRHDAPANAIVFETSPDSIDFTERHRVVLSRSVSALTAELSAGTSSPTNPGATVFDNFGLVTSTFQFSAASYIVEEGGGSILITVTRVGSTTATATVDYATADGTARQASKYILAAGRLTFAPNEASKTFPVLIVDNAQPEGNQNLNLLLQEPANSGLNTPGRAVLTIADNDTAAPTSNPLDDPTFYVQQHYYDFLNRVPDAAGLAFWVNEITSCGRDTQCIEVKRINVSAAYFLSIEFQETGFLVHRFYNLALNRPNGLPRYLEFFRDTQSIGSGVVVNATGWEALLEANKIAYADKFVAQAEYTALYPLTHTTEEHVDALYTHAGITPSAAERQASIDEFNNPTGARGRVLRRVAEDATLRIREFNRAFVLAQYFGYLRRNPDDAPDNNLDGYNFWLNKLNLFNDYRDAEMVKSFVVSGEYRQRFGP